MKDYSKTATLILEQVGGKDNVIHLTHCMTRLRFTLVNDSNINEETIKEIPNVLGVVKKGGQFQVIIGNDVNLCFTEVQKRLDDKNELQQKQKFTIKGWGVSILDAISGSIAPIIPVILGCGMVKIFIIMLDLMGVSAKLPTYQILTIIGDTGYYFLPLLLAYSASKKFNCNTPLAMTIVAILVHPSLIQTLANGNSSFLTIPVTSASYSSSVIPALLSVWLLSKVEPLSERVFTGWKRTLLKPLAILLVCTPIILIILAPLGMLIGNGMAAILSFMYSKVGWLTIGIYSAILPFVVMSGMHVAVFPYIFTNLDSLGYDYLQLPAMLAYNFSQAAAAAAVAIKSKDKDMKATAMAAAISACVGGITEPALYGVNLKLKKPLIASMIGSGVSGLLIGFLGIKAFAFSGPCLLSFPMFASNEFTQNFMFACLATFVSVTVTFVLTLVFGWEEDIQIEEKQVNKIQIDAPLSGKIIPLTEVSDPAFAQGLMGKGVAILPDKGVIYAPFDGQVLAIFPTYHAIGIKAFESGLELLIHIGLETVNLEGMGFTSSMKMGDSFHKGDILIKFDLEMLKKLGYDVTTPIIVTNSQVFKEIDTLTNIKIKELESLLQIER